MTTTLWLRVSAIIMLVFTLGHTLGGLGHWSPMGENAVLEAMRTVRFDAMGASRTYFDFYMGFGWMLSVTMLMEAILLWLLAGLARSDAALVRPMVSVIALSAVAGAILSWRFLFPVPALFSLVLVVCLAMALVASRASGSSERVL